VLGFRLFVWEAPQLSLWLTAAFEEIVVVPITFYEDISSIILKHFENRINTQFRWAGFAKSCRTMATQNDSELFLHTNASRADVEVELLGDSAVGKTKLVERFLLKEYNPVNNSTYPPTLYEHHENLSGRDILVSLWDTAGQEQFESIHSSFF
jgi:hypothetical protein